VVGSLHQYREGRGEWGYNGASQRAVSWHAAGTPRSRRRRWGGESGGAVSAVHSDRTKAMK